MGEKRGSCHISAWREKVVVGKDFSHQNNFDHQKVLFNEGVIIRCLFALKTPTKIDLNSRRFLFWVDFEFLAIFWWPWTGSRRSIRCFLGVFVKNRLKISFFYKNNKEPRFSSFHIDWILGCTNNVLSTDTGDT